MKRAKEYVLDKIERQTEELSRLLDIEIATGYRPDALDRTRKALGRSMEALKVINEALADAEAADFDELG